MRVVQIFFVLLFPAYVLSCGSSRVPYRVTGKIHNQAEQPLNIESGQSIQVQATLFGAGAYRCGESENVELTTLQREIHARAKVGNSRTYEIVVDASLDLWKPASSKCALAQETKILMLNGVERLVMHLDAQEFEGWASLNADQLRDKVDLNEINAYGGNEIPVQLKLDVWVKPKL
ncbi:MAG: hypothetical protein AB1540_04815 [Bdellovibrionota bacterium]